MAARLEPATPRLKALFHLARSRAGPLPAVAVPLADAVRLRLPKWPAPAAVPLAAAPRRRAPSAGAAVLLAAVSLALATAALALAAAALVQAAPRGCRCESLELMGQSLGADPGSAGAVAVLRYSGGGLTLTGGASAAPARILSAAAGGGRG